MLFRSFSPQLGCMNAAKWPSHPHPTRPDMATCEGHRCLRVHEASIFFFPFPDSRRFVPTRSELVPIGRNCQFWPKPLIHVEIKKKRCKMHRFGQNNKTLTTQPLSHTQSHSQLTLTLTQSHPQLTHNLTDPLSILSSQLSSSTHSQESKLRYQTKAFNLSFSIF